MNEPSDDRPSYPIESVDNALQLLLIMRRDGSLRIGGAALELEVSRSTVHRLLAMLKYRGFVVQDSHRRYLPGPMFRNLGSGVSPTTLMPVARPHMQRLAEETGETISLMVLKGTRVRFIEGVEGTEVLRVGNRVGASLPAHRASGGKILLAELGRAEVDRLYASSGLGPDELAAVHKELSTTRRRGCGLNLEETEAGVVAVAMCVRDADANALAALSVSGPTIRYRKTAILDLLPQLKDTVEAIRRDIVGG